MMDLRVFPEGGIESLELADILDVRGIELLMENFYKFSSIPMAIIDLKGSVLVGVGWQDICTKFHRVHPNTSRSCIESDLQLSDGVPEGEFNLYKCKNGMWDMATPILVGGKKMGNLFMGQFFFEDEEHDLDFFRKQAAAYGFDEKQYLDALDRVPHLSRESIETGKVFFMNLTVMLSASSYSNILLAHSLAQVEALNQSLRKSEQRLESLMRVSQHPSGSVEKLLDFVLHEAITLTGSKIGYIYNYDEKKKEFTLNSWSKDVMEECTITEKQTVYQLENTGIWGEAVRQAGPIIVNDFSKPNPLKKGFPAGHAKLDKYMTLPIIIEGTILGVVGVANKELDYDDSDVRQLTLLLDTAWKITQSKKAEEKLHRLAEDLARSNKDLEQFAYVASHDLKEPLRAVAGFMGLLKKRMYEDMDPRSRDFVDNAIEGAERMHMLINDLLTFSRVGTRGGAFSAMSMKEAVDIAVRNLKISIEESQAVLTFESLPVITADILLMTQLMQNLIGNAIKFRGERCPEINVAARRESRQWVFSVRDNGIGIEQQYYDRIFLIFQRLHTRDEYGGTGIGLALCKKIVERHGGTLWVESAPGKGSTFYFTIPDKGNNA